MSSPPGLDKQKEDQTGLLDTKKLHYNKEIRLKRSNLVKKMVLILSLFAFNSILSWTAAAVDSSAQADITKGLFYNHEQFLKLTDAEQRIYLRELQSIFSEMSQNSDYFSQNIIDSESRWALLLQLQNAFAGGDQLIENLKPVTEAISRIAKAVGQIEAIKKGSDYKNEEIQKLYEASIIEYAKAQKTFNTLKDSTNSNQAYLMAKDNLSNASSLIIHYTNLVKTPNNTFSSYLREQELKKKSALLTALSEGKIDPSVNIETLSPIIRLTTSVAATTEEVAPSAAKPSPIAKSAPLTTKKAAPVALAEPKPITDEQSRKIASLADGYACMNSGFIIKTPPCEAPNNLNTMFKLQGLKDENAFSCPKGQQICNPFLFGFKPKACKLQLTNTPEFKTACINKNFQPGELPYCVRNNSNATKQCSELSKDTDSINNAVELIKMNPEAWNTYRNDFYKLCDDDYINFNNIAKFNRRRKVTQDYIRIDIKKTCEVAKKRVAQLNEKYHVTTTPIKLPGSSSGGAGTTGSK